MRNPVVSPQDTTFTYMLHPVTGTPLFAHVDMLEPGRRDREELRCFYAAQYEMVKIRWGGDGGDGGWNTVNGKFQMGFNGIWVGLKVEYTQDMAIFMGQMGDGMLNILLF
jgi:hypothetical protein